MTIARKTWLKRFLAVFVVGAGACLLALAASRVVGFRDAIGKVNDAIYDACYGLRPLESQAQSPVILVEIDQASLDEAQEYADIVWPWPRGAAWGDVVKYLDRAGAKAVVFDLLFSERSVYRVDDDIQFAAAIDEAKIPVVIAVAGVDGKCVIKTNRPIAHGDTDITTAKVYRDYRPTTARGDSLALAAVRASGAEPKLPTDLPFRLRFYGPHRDTEGNATFDARNAFRILLNAADEKLAEQQRIDPNLFKDRIVLIGPTAAGMHDLKSTPVSTRYPGVEVHATAILNLLRGHEVQTVSHTKVTALAGVMSFVVAAGVILIYRPSFKLIGAAVCLAGITLLVVGGMRSDQMRWLAPAEPLLAMLIATVGGLVWSYGIENARSRFLLKALSQCISPEVADALAADPSQLQTGGQQRELTILFTDLQGFTDITERLKERIEPVLNLYLGEMSLRAFDYQGTIDKYIGDAIMVFWNAPIDQDDHALRACETAVAIVEHERKIAPDLARLGADLVRTRIGIHTGAAIVGFFGSRRRLSYTVVGDSVNLASRLESANKFYGTQVLVSRETMLQCGETMLFRPIDRVRVYGHTEPIGLYELVARRRDATPDQVWLVEASARAAEAYLRCEWDECLRIVDEVRVRFPDDGPAHVWRERVAEYKISPPPEGWDGVFEAKSK